MEMERMVERLVAAIEKMDAKRRHQEKTEARINANNEKFEVLRGTLVSRMDTHQARTKAIQEEIMSKMDAHQERMETSMNAWRHVTIYMQFNVTHPGKSNLIIKT
jgi:hypothetical protein